MVLVQPSRGPTQEAVFLGAMTRTGAIATVKQVFRPGVVKTGPPPMPMADVFCTVRVTYSDGLSGQV
jgi:hypothetical protein